MTKFPTIREMADALSWVQDLHQVKYDQKSLTFRGLEFVQYPCRDDGGSIDSIDFNVYPVEVPFAEAYRNWEYMKEIEKINKEIIDSLPPFPIEDEECDLPF